MIAHSDTYVPLRLYGVEINAAYGAHPALALVMYAVSLWGDRGCYLNDSSDGQHMRGVDVLRTYTVTKSFQRDEHLSSIPYRHDA